MYFSDYKPIPYSLLFHEVWQTDRHVGYFVLATIQHDQQAVFSDRHHILVINSDGQHRAVMISMAWHDAGTARIDKVSVAIKASGDETILLQVCAQDGRFQPNKYRFIYLFIYFCLLNSDKYELDRCTVRNKHNTVFDSKRSAICAQAVYFLHSTMPIV